MTIIENDSVAIEYEMNDDEIDDASGGTSGVIYAVAYVIRSYVGEANARLLGDPSTYKK